MKKVLKTVYDKIPLKREVFSIVKKFAAPSERTYRHLHFRGNIKVKIDDSHSFKIRHYGYEVENSIFWAGLTNGWEKVSLSIWIKLARSADVVFDIGANTGVYSLIAKSLNPQAQVYAFEPVKRVFEKLEFNNQLNGYDINCFERAASDSDGTAIIYDTADEHTYSVTIGKNLNAPDVPVKSVNIETVRLDTLVENLRIPKIDLIKLDVETYEPEVIEGLGRYLEEFKPTMLVEVLNDDVGRRIESLVNGKGYVYLNLDEEMGTIKPVRHISKSDDYNYLICSEEVAKLVMN
ncbi:MAG: FkbM family methyltransferase [Parachlamydiaceae bacterium]|nr:FkbM family methyltransferase [Parachlamydiaceae bacterium]